MLQSLALVEQLALMMRRARSSALGSGSKTSDRCDCIYPELSIRIDCDRSDRGELRLSQPSHAAEAQLQ
jgi:hypothetical protein